MKYRPGMRLFKQNAHEWGVTMKMDEVYDLFMDLHFTERKQKPRKRRLLSCFPQFIEKISVIPRDYTDEELKEDPYYEYLVTSHRFYREGGISSRLEKHCLNIMRDGIKLYWDIKVNGLKAPLDLTREKGRLILHRGYRRFVILKKLDYETVLFRLYKNKEAYLYHLPQTVRFGDIPENGVHNCAIKQFVAMGYVASDKYWVHNYTPLYDFHFKNLLGKKIKLLEFGVLRGASLLLWRDVFRKGRIYGVDSGRRWQRYVRRKRRIKIFSGRQEDVDFLKEKVVPHGPYDIVVDDASHYPDMQLASFKTLWPHINPGGFYVIEDLHNNYHEKFSPNGPTMIEEMKKLLDTCLNGTSIRSMNFYYNIAFIQKA